MIDFNIDLPSTLLPFFKKFTLDLRYGQLFDARYSPEDCHRMPYNVSAASLAKVNLIDDITTDYSSLSIDNTFDEATLKIMSEEFPEMHANAMQNRIECVNAYLETLLQEENIPPKLAEAMRYSLLAGGKRIRPILCLVCARMALPAAPIQQAWDTPLYQSAVNLNWVSALPLAAALEMIHTYSLIHDDLPSMDNDDLRRGKATCHKVFNEATAILAGDALLSDAFYFISQCNIPAREVLAAVQEVAAAVGSQGLVGGQKLDLEAEGKEIDLKELCKLNSMKTGALIRAACVAGAKLSGSNKRVQEAVGDYGTAIGIAFQIIDDVLDVEGDTALLGKNVGRDAQNKKATWVSLIGLEESKKEAKRYCDEAVKTLDNLLRDELQSDKINVSRLEIKFLQKIAHDMVKRVF